MTDDVLRVKTGLRNPFHMVSIFQIFEKVFQIYFFIESDYFCIIFFGRKSALRHISALVASKKIENRKSEK